MLQSRWLVGGVAPKSFAAVGLDCFIGGVALNAPKSFAAEEVGIGPKAPKSFVAVVVGGAALKAPKSFAGGLDGLVEGTAP